MSVNVDRILELLTPNRVNREIGMAHDEARERFHLPSLTARDSREFKYIVTTYYQHHMRYTGQGTPSEEQAFGDVKRLLDHLFEEDEYQKGYNVALQMGIDGSRGGLREVLNKLTDALKAGHMKKYFDHVFHDHVDPLSKADHLDLSRAYFQRFGHLLRQFGLPCDEMTFAWNTEAALRYHLEALEKIFSNARKI